MNIGNLSVTKSDLAVILAESQHFRAIVASALTSTENDINNPKSIISWPTKEGLAILVAKIFSDSSKIPAIKFVRQWAIDNNVTDLQSLAESKSFVEKAFGYY